MERLRRIAKEVFTVAVLALVLFSARSSLADHYVVPTSSMEYTLMPGDRVLVNKLAYGLRVPFIGWRLIGSAQPVNILTKFPRLPMNNLDTGKWTTIGCGKHLARYA